MELADDANEPTAKDDAKSALTLAPLPPAPATSDSPGLRPESYIPRTLKHDLRTRGALPLGDCLSIAISLTRALEHLHAHRLVHRDIKPSNVIFVRGVPKLADIGLVTSIDATRSFVGTDGYIPPEGPGTPQADLYSLGKVLYECLTGKDRIEFPELPTEWRTRPDAGPLLEFNEILTKACEADPDRRYVGASALLVDLALLQGGQSIKRQRTVQSFWFFAKRAGWAVSLLSALIAIGVFLSQKFGASDWHSAIRGVDELVAEGNHCLTSELPSRRLAGIKCFQDALSLDPTCLPAKFGIFNANPMFSAEARAAARELMKFAPASCEAHNADACVKWWDWQFRDALVEARAATKLPPANKGDLAFAHCLVGWFLLETGHPNQALKEYQLAEHLLPANPIIESHLGHPYFVQGRFQECTHHYTNSLTFEPSYLLAHRMMAEVYEAKGDILKAIDEYEMGQPTDKKGQNARFYEQLRDAARTGGAKGCYGRWLELESSGGKTNSYWIGRTYAAQGNMDEAYHWLERAVQERDNGVADNFMVSFVWDHRDKRFQETARRIGLLQ